MVSPSPTSLRLAAEADLRKKEKHKKEVARQEALRERRRKAYDTPTSLQNPQSPRIHLCEDGVPRVALRRTDLGTHSEHVKVLGLSTGRKSGIMLKMFHQRKAPSYSQLLKSFVAIQAAVSLGHRPLPPSHESSPSPLPGLQQARTLLFEVALGRTRPTPGGSSRGSLCPRKPRC